MFESMWDATVQAATTPKAWIAFATLTVLEVVLGIDNIIFISILAGRLEEAKRAFARNVGLLIAMVSRLVLLFLISWVITLERIHLFEIPGGDPEHPSYFTVKSVVLMLGGLFLLAKSTLEIHHALEGGHEKKGGGKVATMGSVLAQIAILDLVFSIDSVITAVGLTDFLPVMVAAILVSVGVMLAAAGPISRFVDRHPTVKMLALAFLVLVGVTLVAESLHFEIPKGYIYFAMAFSVGVEMLNLQVRNVRARAKAKRTPEPVHLRKRIEADPTFVEDGSGAGHA